MHLTVIDNAPPKNQRSGWVRDISQLGFVLTQSKPGATEGYDRRDNSPLLVTPTCFDKNPCHAKGLHNAAGFEFL